MQSRACALEAMSRASSSQRDAARPENERQRDPVIAGWRLADLFAGPVSRASRVEDHAAPIRNFTEYAGLRPSILASTVAGAPSVKTGSADQRPFRR